MMAARGNHKDAVKVLLEKGADPNLKNDWDMTALDVALKKDHNEVAKLLRVRVSDAR